MADTLESVKSYLSRRHLGRNGIHGIGVRETENAVCLHVASRSGLVASGALAEIEQEAAPFRVMVVEDVRASLAGGAPPQAPE